VKKYLRSHCEYNIRSLRENIPKALNSIDVDLVKRFYGKVRRYEVLYSANVSTLKAVEIVKGTGPTGQKQKKSHRRISEANLLELHVGNNALHGLCYCSCCS